MMDDTQNVQNTIDGEDSQEKGEEGAPNDGNVVVEKTGNDACVHCEKKQKEAEEYKLGWQRALADYTNLQKETKNRMSEWVQMSTQQILEEFIPVYDNFKKAFAHHPTLDASSEEGKRIKNWIDGIGFIMKQFSEVLKTHQVEEIKTVGEMFNPTFHESVGEEEVEGKKSGEIVKEVDGGYMLADKILKAAKVVVAK
jgi:molecular chaperone GrpE